MFWTSILLILLPLCPLPYAHLPSKPFSPDANTTLLVHLDKSGLADVASGSREPDGDAELIQDGKFGGALYLSPNSRVRFAGDDGNFPEDEGTLEFWIRPHWAGNDGMIRPIFDCAADGQNYIKINKLRNNKLGAAMAFEADKGPSFYERADVSVESWRPNEWHHVAICWDAQSLALYLDGKAAARRDGSRPIARLPDDLTFSGSDYDLDELRISDTVRYGPEAQLLKSVKRAPTRPARVGAERTPRRGFIEPDGVYRCSFSLPDEPRGIHIIPKNYLDDFDPQQPPLPANGATRLEVAAFPNEKEPASFVLMADRNLAGVDITVSDLKGGNGVLPASRIEVRRVVRSPMRRFSTAKADNFQIVGRFLPRWQKTDMPAHEFREIWLSIDVPADCSGGDFVGEVRISASMGAVTVPLSLHVYPFELREPRRKFLGCYYHMANRFLDPDRIKRELADMKVHGVKDIHPGLAIRYLEKDLSYRPDLTQVRRGLALLREQGFGGTVIIDTGLATLAKQMGVGMVARKTAPPDFKRLEEDETFCRAARTAGEEFKKVQTEFPEFRLALTHLDEVFGGHDLLDYYITLTRVAKQVPGIPFYITFHTADDKADGMRQRLDPYVDIRCNHGFSFEMWLARGHTMEEYEAELKASGDEAWFYHNARGVHFTPKWARIINGIYLWAGPFRTHIPWIYQSYKKNPFNDLDGGDRGHDAGFSFPGISDPADLVPTRLWEAMREGYDDLRYIATLEDLIAENAKNKPAEASAAQAYLDKLRALIRQAGLSRPSITQPAARAKPGEPDLDTGLTMVSGPVRSAGEAPLINALATRFSGDDLQAIRRTIAEHILALRAVR